MVSVALDISLFVQILNFLVLMFVLNLFLYKPLRKILQERESLFESFRHLSDVAKKQLEDGEAEKARRRSEILMEGVQTMNSLKEAGQERERVILANAQEESGRRLEGARQTLRQETAEARQILEQEARKLASDMAGQLLGRQL
ncbi:MAG: ATP synthase F0 subunit B [Deltaproteobacteria bacterium]|jgi:F-type H+-transporting ATPase subunit b|nr:ATP synthase F0 subunit B [Deltaproteobacteria bacterium]